MVDGSAGGARLEFSVSAGSLPRFLGSLPRSFGNSMQISQKWVRKTRLRHNVWVFYDLPGSGTSSPEHLGMAMAKRLSRLRKP